jgi:putative ABC transport system permease protein
MISFVWIAGHLRRRAGRLAATAIGVAVAVALLASLGAFLAHSKATMTKRSVENVPIDWQVESTATANRAQLLGAVRSYPGVQAALPVDFGQVSSLQATTAGTQQLTGSGWVLGIPSDYRATFPAVIRTLVGSQGGVQVAQQTAANLHVAPGDTIKIGRAGLPAVDVVAGSVIDLPSADALFQTVGAPPGATAQAPPDTVLIVPDRQWHQIFDPLAKIRPDLVKTQIHTRIAHTLPTDPSAAYSNVVGRANNLEVTLAGAGKVGNNIGATLASARSDALYAQVLFLFLGVPGAVLAALLTATVAAAGRDRRRREQALLRSRGASTPQLVRLAFAETALVALVGALIGIGAAAIIGSFAFGSASFGTTTTSAVGWAGAAAFGGLLVATAAVAGPAWSDARRLTVSASRRRVDRHPVPRWSRYGLDLWLLSAGALIFWLTTRGGYQLVLAPEGVPTISVNYWAFAGPALMWLGGGLLAWRIAETLLRRGRRPLRFTMRPLAGPLAGTVAAGMQRQRRLLARGVALVALTATFAISTAVFNATYRQQALADAILTNGADVTVNEPPGVAVGPTLADSMKNVPGVVHVEPLQHRYAYVGSDLQDLFGVNPTTVVGALKLQSAYFQGGGAGALMHQLQQRPDSLIVSAETVKDFQLQPGDQVTLRLQDFRTKQYVPVRFHYVGIGKEFPTAPRDSFLLANREYIAAQTHSDGVASFLVDTGHSSPAPIADALRRELGAAVTVTDLTHTRHIVASSLTAVDLAGLTRVELGFALALAAAASGLVLWLGFFERRRTFAIVHALGARRRQVGAFVWGEAGYVLATGLVLGGIGGALLSQALIKILTGVFDPPPSSLAVPWSYLTLAIVVAVAAVGVAATLALREADAPHMSVLRDV